MWWGRNKNKSLDETVEASPNLDLSGVRYVHSPNRSNRNDNVRCIVLHHTGPGSFNGILNWLTNPQAKASAHYLIGKEGELVQMVNTQKKAWHAGRSKMFIDDRHRHDVNQFSIGIELCNPGILQKGNDGNFYCEIGREARVWRGEDPKLGYITYPSGVSLEGYYVPYPDKQIDKLVMLCKSLVKKYPQIGPKDITTHLYIAEPKGRKNDPFGLDVDGVIDRIFN